MIVYNQFNFLGVPVFTTDVKIIFLDKEFASHSSGLTVAILALETIILHTHTIFDGKEIRKQRSHM